MVVGVGLTVVGEALWFEKQYVSFVLSHSHSAYERWNRRQWEERTKPGSLGKCTLMTAPHATSAVA